MQVMFGSAREHGRQHCVRVKPGCAAKVYKSSDRQRHGVSGAEGAVRASSRYWSCLRLSRWRRGALGMCCQLG
jgi:hypothetical protein